MRIQSTGARQFVVTDMGGVPFRNKLCDFVEVRVDYTGPADGDKAVLLDHVVLPLLREAPELLRLLASAECVIDHSMPASGAVLGGPYNDRVRQEIRDLFTRLKDNKSAEMARKLARAAHRRGQQ